MEGRENGVHRQSTRRILFVSAVLLFAAVALAVGAVAASSTTGGDAGLTATDNQEELTDTSNALSAETIQSVGPAPFTASLDNDVTIPHDAYTENEYGIVPEDTAVEEANDTVDVAITAQDLGGGEGDLTSFRFDVRYDPVKLDFNDNVDLVAGAISATDDDRDAFDYEEKTPGVITIDWYVEIGFDDVWDMLFDDDGPDDPYPEFADETLFTLEFEPSQFAEVGDTAEIDILAEQTNHPDENEPIVWSDMIGVFGSDEYDSDDIWWGSGEVEVIPESLEPAIEGADGTFTARSTGGYIDFGQHDDPGEDEETLATFPGLDEDEQILIEGDYRLDDGKWRAEPDDVDFPEIAAGDSNAPARVLVDEPFEGEIDVENESMTMDGVITISVNVLDEDFWFEFDTTSGESGELVGDADFDVDTETLDGDGTTTLVGNEFVVIEEEQENVDELRESANLERNGEWVADQPGENYLVYDFALEFEEFIGEESELVGSVVDETGQPIEGASVDIVDSQADDAVTGTDGSFALDGLDPETWDVRVNAEGYEPITETITFEPLETEERTFELTPGETNFEVDIQTDDQIAVGETLPIRATIENTDTGADEQTIQLSADGEAVASETVELGEDIEDNVTPDELPTTVDVDFEWTPEEEGEYELEVTSEDDSQTVSVDVVGADDIDIDAIMDVEVQTGSYVAFDEDSLADAEAEQILLPPQESGEEAFSFRAEIVDGEWSASPGDISFPDFEAIGYHAEPDVPLGLEGEVDQENDRMTLEGGFEVDIPDVGAVLEFDTVGTTGDSGAMSGSGSIDDETGSVVLVANEFVVPETGSDDIDSILEPPVPEGQNWLLLELELNIQDVDDVDLTSGDLVGVITDQEGEPVDGATVSVVDEPGDTSTDEDGAFELTDVSTGSQELVVSGDSIQEETVSVTIEEDETTTVDIEVEGGDAEFEITLEDDSAIAGDSVELVGVVDNVGNAPGSATAALAIGDRVSTNQNVELDADESGTVALEWGTNEADEGEYTATMVLEDETVEATVVIEEPIDDEDGPDAFIEMENTGDGYISFDETSESDAIEEGLPFPANEIIIEGEVYGDRWQATGVQFPTLDAGAAEAAVDATDFGGTIDTEAETLTISGDLAVDVLDFDGEPFEFDIDATTGESGVLAGSATIDDDGGSAVVVDNQYTVNDETGSAADGVLGLPLTEPGSAWIELSLDVALAEIEGDGPDTGTLEGTVIDESGEPIEDATVDVVDELDETTTESDGSYRFDRLDTGSYEILIEASGYADGSETVEIEVDETTEQSFELEAGVPELTYEVESSGASPGETVTATATVSNTGDGPATEDLTLVIGEEEWTETVTIDPGKEETVTAEWQTNEDDAGSYAASLRVDDEVIEESDQVVIEPEDEPESAVVIEGSGGYVAFSQGSEADAEDAGIDMPAFTIVADLDEETGEIEADPADVTFSEDLEEPQTGTPAAVSTPEGFEGTVDLETGEMQLDGTLEADIYELGESFAFDVSLRTGDSGALSGSASYDVDEETGSITLVDNEYDVAGTDEAAINQVLGLPSDSGESWLVLEATVDLTTADEADQAGGGDQNGSSDADGTDDEEEPDGETTFLTSLGLLGGIAGVGAATTLVLVNLMSRFVNVIDPDPGN